MDQIIGAIVGAVVTGILGIIAYLYQQRRGNRVIVKMISQTPQISFSDSVQQKLEIIYNGRKVKDLVLTQFSISNQGSNIIKPLKLTVGVKPKSGSKSAVDLKITDKDVQQIISNFTYAELNVTDPQEITTSKMDSETGTFEIERPYLNPQKKYKEEEIKVSVFSDVVLDFSVNGGGEDWASKLVLEDPERIIILSPLVYLLAILSSIVSFLVLFYSNFSFSFNLNIKDLVFVTLAIVMVVTSLVLSKKWRK